MDLAIYVVIEYQKIFLHICNTLKFTLRKKVGGNNADYLHE